MTTQHPGDVFHRFDVASHRAETPAIEEFLCPGYRITRHQRGSRGGRSAGGRHARGGPPRRGWRPTHQPARKWNYHNQSEGSNRLPSVMDIDPRAGRPADSGCGRKPSRSGRLRDCRQILPGMGARVPSSPPHNDDAPPRGAQFLIAWRNPTVKLKDGTPSAGKRILIDGQQRVTALMAALLGREVLN